MKKFAGMSNRQIGQLFGDLSHSGVAKAHQRLSTKLQKDKSLRKTVEGIIADLTVPHQSSILLMSGIWKQAQGKSD